MSDLIDTIKDLAHQVTESYLTLGIDPNTSIIEMSSSGLIDNDEVLKRVIEISNQNIYLSFFNDSSVDKTGIKFPLADYDSIKNITKKNEDSMQDYLTAPKDFRLETLVAEPIEKKANEFDKLASLNECIEWKNRFDQFVAKVDMLKQASAAEAVGLFNQMARDTKVMVANGDSIGDISKLACLNLQKEGLSFEKTAEAYDLIHKELVKSGFSVKTEFTKVSSFSPNPKAEVLQPAKNFALAVEKYAAFHEMGENAKKTRDQFASLINATIKNGKK